MLQIYFDFSGYSDMAIGLGKIFGFEITENFNLPYISQSINEFWRRWHISLSTWFKQYLYIPLGGNKKGNFRTYINLFIVFFVTGLWHGASWNYVVWGLFNSFFIIIEKIKLKKILDKNKCKSINHIYTLFVILISWVIFRADWLRNAIKLLKIMFIPTNINVDYSLEMSNIFTISNILIFIIAILLSGLLQKVLDKLNNEKIIKEAFQRFIEPFLILILLIISIASIISGTVNSYIYFKF